MNKITSTLCTSFKATKWIANAIIISTCLLLACSPGGKNANDVFRVKEAVDEILLANSNGQKIVLKKQEDHWIVNDKYKARKDMIDILLKTIKKVQINYPVPVKEQEGIIKSIAAKHVKVELYKAGKMLKSYFVGSHTQDMMGTYFFLKDSKRPYVCFIPGFEGYLTPRYFTQEKDWRSRVLFDIDPTAIKTIEVAYDDSIPGLESFKIEQTKDIISLTNLKTNISQDLSDAALGKQYLSFYKYLEIEGFENDHAKKDSIVNSRPFCAINILTQEGQQQSVNIYLMDITQRSKTQFDRKGNKLEYDLDRMFVSFNNGQDFGIIQMFVFGKLFQNYSSF